jgi:prophage DNA circulation protein
MSWKDQLRPAKWRGLSFGVFDTGGKFGRSTAVHEYAFRDDVWVEDLGRATRRIGIRGFIVGDDVANQLQALIEAAEEEGPGQLIHPLLGERMVSLVDFEPVTRAELGRVVELTFSFIEGSGAAQVTVGTDVSGKIAALADQLDMAATADFARSAGAALQQGADVVKGAVRTVKPWVGTAQNLTLDAGNLVSSMGALVPGANRTLGRFLSGSRGPLADVQGAINTANGQISRVNRARAAVTQSASDVLKLVSKL